MLGAIKQMAVRYHRSLVARSEAMDPRTRWLDVKGVMLPWMWPMAGMILVGLLLNPQGAARLWLLPFGAVSLAGMTYAGAVFLISGIRSDVRRLTAARSAPPPEGSGAP
jgi:hypothetical protein